MDLTPSSIIEKLVTVGLSGGASFLGALYQFKTRLELAEEYIKELKGENKDVVGIRQLVEAVRHGWRLEFDSYKADYEAFKKEVEREREHEEELDQAFERARASRPDPVEELKHQLSEMKREFDRMKNRGYVKSSEFAEYVRKQDEEWRRLERTLGRWETLLKQ